MRLLLNSWVIGAFLVLASVLTWNHRFEVSDHLLNETAINEAFLESVPESKRRHCSFKETPEGFFLQIERKEGVKGSPSITMTISDLEDVRFLYFQYDYRLRDVVAGKTRWMKARGILADTLANGSKVQPSDYALFEGVGTQDWTKVTRVRELTDSVTETHFNFASLGPSGSLDLRDLRFAKVSQRAWVPFASVSITLGSIALFFNLLRKRGIKTVTRAGAASFLLFAAIWVGVFPRTCSLFQPILGTFSLTLPDLSQNSPKTTTALPKTPPSSTKTFSVDKPKSDTTPSLLPTIEEKTITRNKKTLSSKFSSFVHDFAWIHLPAFCVLSLLWFLVTNQEKSWPFIVALAILSEASSPLTHYGCDLKDALDLVLNLLGVGLGFLVWRQIKRLPQRLRKEKA